MAGKTDAELVEEAVANETKQAGTGIAMDMSENLDVVTENGGYATLYDQRTGEPSTVRLFEGDKTLRKYLEKTDENGKRVFGMRKPKVSPKAADIPCWLNAASDRFTFFAELGLAPTRACTKMLRNQSEVLSHMENTHPDELKASNAERDLEREARSEAREEKLAAAYAALAQKG